MSTPGEQKVEISLPQNLQPFYWGALALGALFVVVGLASQNGLGFMILGCFLGIVSRIIQAEQHHRVLRKSS
jgi:hypothetical protein